MGGQFSSTIKSLHLNTNTSDHPSWGVYKEASLTLIEEPIEISSGFL